MPPSARPRLDAGTAQLLAWIGLAAVNAVFIARLRAQVPPGVRASHYFYDAGQLLAAGVLAAAVVRGWQRFGLRGRVAPYAALWLGSMGMAWVFVRADLANLAERGGGERWGPILLILMTVAASLSLPAAALLGSSLSRRLLRAAGVATALLAAIANELLLHNDYRGVHLFTSLGASILGGCAVTGAALPALLGARKARLAARGAAAALAVVGAVAVSVRPRERVQAELFRVDGAVVGPILARVTSMFDRGEVNLPPENAAWFRDRSAAPPVLASTLRLLPADGIVLLVTVDSMRASLFSNPTTREKFPQLAALRERAVDFTMARSPGSRTLPTWGSVFTGKYYSGLEWRGVNIGKDPSIRFPMLLAKAGISSVNFVSCSQLGNANLKGGFTEEISIPPRKGQTYATSTEVMPRIIERLGRHREGPLFVFAHLMDPHFPYDSVTKEGPPFARFVAEVAQADGAIGALWDMLAARGLLDRTALIVAADHGEAFGQHDTPYHTITLYEELIRVPLVVRVPGVTPRRVEQPVSLIDLGPTILDLFGLSTPGSFLGQSLSPYLRGESPALTRPIAAERGYTRALLLGSRKVIIDSEKGTHEIYDLLADPDETNNLMEALSTEGEAQLKLLRTFFEAHARGATSR